MMSFSRPLFASVSLHDCTVLVLKPNRKAFFSKFLYSMLFFCFSSIFSSKNWLRANPHYTHTLTLDKSTITSTITIHQVHIVQKCCVFSVLSFTRDYHQQKRNKIAFLNVEPSVLNSNGKIPKRERKKKTMADSDTRWMSEKERHIQATQLQYKNNFIENIWFLFCRVCFGDGMKNCCCSSLACMRCVHCWNTSKFRICRSVITTQHEYHHIF